MQLVLRESVDLEKLGPELLSIDRGRLATQLDIAKVQAPSRKSFLRLKKTSKMLARLNDA